MFERMEDFLTNCGQESGLFFREWTWPFFDEIWAWEQLFFQETSGKMASAWLIGPIVCWSFDRIDVFSPNIGMTLACLSGTLFEKMTWGDGIFESGLFLRWAFFL